MQNVEREEQKRRKKFVERERERPHINKSKPH
jgi:hypothetical protein